MSLEEEMRSALRFANRYAAVPRVTYGAVRWSVTDPLLPSGAVAPSDYAVRLAQAIGPVMRCGHNHGLMVHEPSGAVRSIYYQCNEYDAVRSYLRRKAEMRSPYTVRYGRQYGKQQAFHDAVRWRKTPTLYFNPDPEGMR